jgi:hypothetical protein
MGRPAVVQIKALNLPRFPLDDLIEALGGQKMVSEITGRQSSLKKASPTQATDY